MIEWKAVPRKDRSPLPPAAVVQFFARQYLLADEGWLQADDGLTYWQGRVAQRITATPAAVGDSFRFRLVTDVLRGVTDADRAEVLCAALNDLSLGWSLAFDRERREVRALSAGNLRLQWRGHLVRLAESARLAAWFSETIAVPLAREAGGEPAWSHPAGRSAPREVPAAGHGYLTARRQRPEWVHDPSPALFLPLGDLAAEHAQRMATPDDAVVVDATTFSLADQRPRYAAMGTVVTAGWVHHPLAGLCWRIELRFDRRATARTASELAQRMFADPSSDLPGGWTVRDGRLAVVRHLTSSDFRFSEQLPLFPGHLRIELSGPTSALLDKGIDVVAAVGDDSSAAPEPDLHLDLLSWFWRSGWDALRDAPVTARHAADPRLLWAPSAGRVLSVGHLDPPSLTTLELLRDADGSTHLARLARHPAHPEYEILGRVSGPGDAAALVRAHLPRLMPALPDLVDLTDAPGAPPTDPALRALLEPLILEHARRIAGPHVLAAETARLRTPRPQLRPQPHYFFDDEPIDPPATTDPATAWLATASHPANLTAYYRDLTWAWDEALADDSATPAGRYVLNYSRPQRSTPPPT